MKRHYIDLGTHPMKPSPKKLRELIAAERRRPKSNLVPLDPVLIAALLTALPASPVQLNLPNITQKVISAKNHIEDMGWSQRKVAALFDMPVSTLNAVLTGKFQDEALLKRILKLPKNF